MILSLDRPQFTLDLFYRVASGFVGIKSNGNVYKSG
jgi:hypothetical protein